MNLDSAVTRKIFECKYPYELPYQSYLTMLEKGFDILENTAASIDNCTDLAELKAIRIALEYRFELMRQFRKKQLKSVGMAQAVLN